MVAEHVEVTGPTFLYLIVLFRLIEDNMLSYTKALLCIWLSGNSN